MAKFRVGQRVKNARPTYTENQDKTGTIVEFAFTPKGTPTRGLPATRDCDVIVLWDDFAPFTNVQHTSQLEPIQDRPEMGSWEALKELGLSPEFLLERVEEYPEEVTDLIERTRSLLAENRRLLDQMKESDDE
jgi:ATP-dependent exoDNAse (exonuclease V) alpha subunit